MSHHGAQIAAIACVMNTPVLSDILMRNSLFKAYLMQTMLSVNETASTDDPPACCFNSGADYEVVYDCSSKCVQFSDVDTTHEFVVKTPAVFDANLSTCLLYTSPSPRDS